MTIVLFIAYFLIGLVLSATLTNLIKIITLKTKILQPIQRVDHHTKTKSNTPTLGGIAIVISIMLMLFLSDFKFNFYLKAVIYSSLALSFVSMIDDIMKVKTSNDYGISGYIRFIIQIIVATIFVLIVNKHETGNFIHKMHLVTAIKVFIFVGTVNAVNLTDGLDGLCIRSVIPSFLSLGFIAMMYAIGHYHFQYLESFTQNLITNVNAEYFSLIIFGLIGICFGFLYHNTYPARIFMGDTGSVFLGSFLVSTMIVFKAEILLLLTGFIFVIEAISVIMQVLYFKVTKGKRIFLMAPIHHHFEKKGIHESTLSTRFGIINLVCNLIGIVCFTFYCNAI